MNQGFFERLYQGYAAEHFVSSELFRRGYEVFRLPADFGLDLVVTNQFRKTSSRETDEHFPFALQVKSRWLSQKPKVDESTERPRAEVDFRLKNDEIEILLENANSGLALVSYFPTEQENEYSPKMVFMTSKHLKQLESSGFLLSESEQRVIRLQYRFRPILSRRDLIKGLKEKGPLNSHQRWYINSELPFEFTRNWDASDYVTFARPDRRRDVTGIVWRAVSVATDFSDFPCLNEISIAD